MLGQLISRFIRRVRGIRVLPPAIVVAGC